MRAQSLTETLDILKGVGNGMLPVDAIADFNRREVGILTDQVGVIQGGSSLRTFTVRRKRDQCRV